VPACHLATPPPASETGQIATLPTPPASQIGQMAKWPTPPANTRARASHQAAFTKGHLSRLTSVRQIWKMEDNSVRWASAGGFIA